MTDELDRYEVPLSNIERTVLVWVQEAAELRTEAPASLLGAESSQDALEALRTVVAVQDRVDTLYAHARTALGRIRRAHAQLRDEVQEATDTAHVNEADRRIEYQSSKDRQAAANLASIEQRRHLRMLARGLDTAQEAYDALRDYHFQFQALREDLRGVLNTYRFEGSLDR